MTPADKARIEEIGITPSEEALHIAARCWCDPETSGILMSHRLATAFAQRLTNLLDLVERQERMIARARDALNSAQRAIGPLTTNSTSFIQTRALAVWNENARALADLDRMERGG